MFTSIKLLEYRDLAKNSYWYTTIAKRNFDFLQGNKLFLIIAISSFINSTERTFGQTPINQYQLQSKFKLVKYMCLIFGSHLIQFDKLLHSCSSPFFVVGTLTSCRDLNPSCPYQVTPSPLLFLMIERLSKYLKSNDLNIKRSEVRRELRNYDIEQA